MSRRHAAGARSRPLHARLAAGGLVLALAVTGWALAVGGPASATTDGPVVDAAPAAGFLRAPSGTASTEVDTDDGTLTLAATPSEGLPATNAQLTVTGSGFNPDKDLWVAVCLDDGAAPRALVHCIGGDIPDENASAAWGMVTKNGKPSRPGPVATKWKKHGSFSLTLQIQSAWEAHCIPGPCSVYTRSADDEDDSQDAHLPVTFVEPGDETPSTTTSASVPPTTDVIGAVPTTVSPEVVQSTALEPGAKQKVLFAGFTPGETVKVTLYSDPIPLPDVTASDGGNVTVEFDVPDDLPPGEHLIEAVGQQSNRVGIAQFQVAAPAPETTETTPTTTATPESTASSAADTATETAIAGLTPTLPSDPTSPGSTGIAAVGPTVTPESADQTGPSDEAAANAADSETGADAGGVGPRLLWLWIALIVLLLVAGAAGLVVMLRSRRDRDAELPRADAAMVDDRIDDGPVGPGWSDEAHTRRMMPPTVAQPPPPAPPPAPPPGPAHGGYGLLTGQDHPDNLGLYAGAPWDEAPTEVVGPGEPTVQSAGWEPHAAPPPATGQDAPPGRDEPPIASTQAWQFDPTDEGDEDESDAPGAPDAPGSRGEGAPGADDPDEQRRGRHRSD